MKSLLRLTEDAMLTVFIAGILSLAAFIYLLDHYGMVAVLPVAAFIAHHINKRRHRSAAQRRPSAPAPQRHHYTPARRVSSHPVQPPRLHIVRNDHTVER